MDAKKLEKYRKRLYSSGTIFGGMRRRNAFKRLAKDGSPEAIRILAIAVEKSNDFQIRELALDNLRKLTDQLCIDVLCGVWFDNRNSYLANVIINKVYIAQKPIEIRVYSALLANKQEVITNAKAEVVEPLIKACEDKDEVIAERAKSCIANMKHQEAIDAICGKWYQTRESFFARIIERSGYVADKPIEIRVYSALLANKQEVITNAKAEVVEPLIKACEDKDEVIAERAKSCIANMKNVDSREAICSFILEKDCPNILRAVIEGNYSPKDSNQRALFFFLTEQWEKYETLDFDGNIMRTIYETADDQLRRRIMEKARGAGRLDWVRTATGGHQGRRLGEMTDSEWETALSVLYSRKNYSEIWHLALMGPPVWSVRMIRLLREAKWLPDQEESRQFFNEVLGLVDRIKDDDKLTLVSPTRPYAELKGHNDAIMALSISPDNKLLTSGGYDRKIYLWDLTEGILIKSLEGHTAVVTALAIDTESSILASASVDHTVRLWSLPEGKLLKTLKGHNGWVNALSISPDGSLLATGSSDKTIRLWSFPEAKHIRTLEGHNSDVWYLSISQDNGILTSGSIDGTICIWDIQEGKPLRTLKNQNRSNNALCVSNDGRILASAGDNNTINIWDIQEDKLIGTLEGHTSKVSALSMIKDSHILVSGGGDNTVRLWIAPEYKLLKTLEGHKGWVSALSMDESFVLASGSVDRTVNLWDCISLFCFFPILQATANDANRLSGYLRARTLDESHRSWLEFAHALMRWKMRFDIMVEEKIERIDVGEFDIEIEG